MRLLQDALIDDVNAPAGPTPLWDTPWHHPAWAERQRAALDDPSRITIAGSLGGTPGNLDPAVAPAEVGECLWRGELRPDGTGGYRLRLDSGSDAEAAGAPAADWPVITLEPALHRWLGELSRPRQVALIGCANPWGPWLRVSRLAEPLS